MTRYTPNFFSLEPENFDQPLESIGTGCEDFAQLISETIRLNQCCPRFNNALPSYLGAPDENTPSETAEADHSIPAFLRK
jgi:hypothetical protein